MVIEPQQNRYPVYSAAQIRAAEAPLLAAEAPGENRLMQRAAYAVARETIRLLKSQGKPVAGAKILVVAGPGGNGGDALYAAHFLQHRGVKPTVLLASGSTNYPEALAALGQVDLVSSETCRWQEYSVIIDGLLGLGARLPLREENAQLVQAINDAGCSVVAVDLPSGLDPDTGAADPHVGAVKAAVTVTFAGLKPAHVFADCGKIIIHNVGFTPAQTVATVVLGLDWWPVPGPQSHKYTGGVLGVYAGSDDYPGAAILAVAGAVAATSPLVRYLGVCKQQVLAAFPSVVTKPGEVDAWVTGPGGFARHLLAAPIPVLLDAEAFSLPGIVPQIASRSAFTVLTPHDGEYHRLTGHKVGADRLAAAAELARATNAVVVLKGKATVVSDGTEHVIVPASASWAATPGSGDVLSGIIGALIAAQPSLNAVVQAVRAHADAAAKLGRPGTALEIAGLLPQVLGEYLSSAPAGE